MVLIFCIGQALDRHQRELRTAVAFKEHITPLPLPHWIMRRRVAAHQPRRGGHLKAPRTHAPQTDTAPGIRSTDGPPPPGPLKSIWWQRQGCLVCRATNDFRTICQNFRFFFRISNGVPPAGSPIWSSGHSNHISRATKLWLTRVCDIMAAQQALNGSLKYSKVPWETPRSGYNAAHSWGTAALRPYSPPEPASHSIWA